MKYSCEGIKKLKSVVENRLLKKKCKNLQIDEINGLQLFNLYRFKLSMLQVFD